MMKQDFSGYTGDDIFSDLERLLKDMNNAPTIHTKSTVIDLSKNKDNTYELSDISNVTEEFFPEDEKHIDLKKIMNNLYRDPAIDNEPFMEPVRITGLGAVLTATAAAMTVVPETAALAVIPYIGATATDYFDGTVSRNTGRTSREGAKFDPLVDKVKNLIIGGTLIAYTSHDPTMCAAMTSMVAATLVFDYQSQKMRGDIIPQVIEGIEVNIDPKKCHYDPPTAKNGNRAVPVGKIKTGLQNAVGLYALTGIAIEASCEIASKYFGVDMPDIVSSGMVRQWTMYPAATALGVGAWLGYLSCASRK